MIALEATNPYLDEFQASMPAWRVPPRMRKLSLERYLLRQRLVAKYAWAIPSPQAIKLLIRHSPLVEMGAGTGYWAWLVRRAGGDIVAFDRYPPPDPRNRWHAGQQPWTEVRPGGAHILARHGDRALFLCWPPEHEPMAVQSLAAYPGERLIYVGELRSGPIFEALDGWEVVESLDLPRWESILDGLLVLRRKRPRRHFAGSGRSFAQP